MPLSVEMLYQTMLNRSSDPEGKAHWCSQLDGGRSRYEILKGFIFSEEFGRLCEEYGIERGTRVPGIGGESMRDAVARIAAAEIGYRETGNNRTKYNQWMYGYDASAPWCSIFICWCVNEARAETAFRIRRLRAAIASQIWEAIHSVLRPMHFPPWSRSRAILYLLIIPGTACPIIPDLSWMWMKTIFIRRKNAAIRFLPAVTGRSNGYQVFGSGSLFGGTYCVRCPPGLPEIRNLLFAGFFYHPLSLHKDNGQEEQRMKQQIMKTEVRK